MNLTAVLICIPVMIRYVEHSFLHIFLGELYIQILCPFLKGVTFFLNCVAKVLYIPGY